MTGIYLPRTKFGLIEEAYSGRETSRFVVLPVPYDLTASYVPGARRGPSAIIEASTFMELYDEELDQETFRAGIHTLPPLDPLSTGPREMVERVEEASLLLYKQAKTLVLLGGEHSMAIGAVRAARKALSEVDVLQLDAHADLRDSYEGSPFSHACTARRILEGGKLVQAGARSLSAEEADFVRSRKDHLLLPSREILNDPRRAAESILDRLGERVYVTIDLDVLDPSVMPSVGTPEPGGIGWGVILDLLRPVFLEREVVGFDLVELCPIPGLVAPDFLAARLAYRLMGYLVKKG